MYRRVIAMEIRVSFGQRIAQPVRKYKYCSYGGLVYVENN